MRGKHTFIIRANKNFLEVLKSNHIFYNFLSKDVILTAMLSDRHDLDFSEIYKQIKFCYLNYVAKTIKLIDLSMGFDYYWSFENYSCNVLSLDEVITRAELQNPQEANNVLNYLIQTNFEKNYEDEV